MLDSKILTLLTQSDTVRILPSSQSSALNQHSSRELITTLVRPLLARKVTSGVAPKGPDQLQPYTCDNEESPPVNHQVVY